MKIRSVGAELFYLNWRTDKERDMTRLIVAFRNFSNSPKESFYIKHVHLNKLCNSPLLRITTSSIRLSSKAFQFQILSILHYPYNYWRTCNNNLLNFWGIRHHFWRQNSGQVNRHSIPSICSITYSNAKDGQKRWQRLRSHLEPVHSYGPIDWRWLIRSMT